MAVSWITPAQDVFDKVQRDFQFPLTNRLQIVSELDKYRWKEDESVWKQKRGLSAYQYEVYFDGVFVCDFGSDAGLDKAYLAVLEGLLKLYKDKRIFWNKELYEVYYPTPKNEPPKLKEATTPEEKMVKEALERVAKKTKKGKRANPAK